MPADNQPDVNPIVVEPSRTTRGWRVSLGVTAVLLVSLALLMVKFARQWRANNDLITAVNRDDTLAAIAALDAGADPNVPDNSIEKSRPLKDRLHDAAQQFFEDD